MADETLGSRDVGRFLSEFHDIAPAEQSAYAGRLKHISRQGFPTGVGTGRGNPARYDADQLFQMLTVTELGQFGVQPARAIKLVSESWPRLRKTVLQVWSSVEAADRGELVKVPSIFWSVPAEAQRHRARPDRAYSPDEADVIRAMTANEVQETLAEEGRYNIRRLAFIAAHQVVADAFQLLKFGHLNWPHERIASFMLSMTPASPPNVEP